MSKGKGIETYKKYWEDQASFMDQAPWNLQKILKLTFSNDFENNIKEFNFSVILKMIIKTNAYI